MLRRTSLGIVLLAALGAGCFASTTPPSDVTEPIAPIAPVLVDECVATAFAWLSDDIAPAPPPGHVNLFANYPLFSPGYQLELYGAEVVVEVDAAYEARLGTTDWGAVGIEAVVFGRAATAEAWRVFPDPDAACPPLPPGTDWPSDW
jgi:hypothetical protein